LQEVIGGVSDMYHTPDEATDEAEAGVVIGLVLWEVRWWARGDSNPHGGWSTTGF